MKLPPQQWPALLRDGGWRRVENPGDYWCKYFRWYKGIRQVVFLNHNLRCWCLLRLSKWGSFMTPCPDLNQALLLADRQPKVSQKSEGRGLAALRPKV